MKLVSYSIFIMKKYFKDNRYAVTVIGRKQKDDEHKGGDIYAVSLWKTYV